MSTKQGILSSVLTKQEMMNRAAEGLASQGFRRCADYGGRCLYTDVDQSQTLHCAWGWVDTSLSSTVRMSVIGLHYAGIGLAAHLKDDDITFAAALQGAHDGSGSPSEMKARLRNLCFDYGLHVPEALK